MARFTDIEPSDEQRGTNAKALADAMRRAAGIVADSGGLPLAGAVAGVRSLLPGGGPFSAEMDRYQRGVAPGITSPTSVIPEVRESEQGERAGNLALGMAGPIFEGYHGTPGPTFSRLRSDRVTSNMRGAIDEYAAPGTSLHFFAKHPLVAESYAGDAGNVARANVNIERPYEVDAQGGAWDEHMWPAVQDATQGYRNPAHKELRDLQRRYSAEHGEDYWDALAPEQQRELSALSDRVARDPVSPVPGEHDGIVMRNILDAAGGEGATQPTDVYVAFRPEQVGPLEWLSSAIRKKGTP